jgi:hypothetical protein
VSRWRIEVFMLCPRDTAIELYEIVAQAVTHSGLEFDNDFTHVLLEQRELLLAESPSNIAAGERLNIELARGERR